MSDWNDQVVERFRRTGGTETPDHGTVAVHAPPVEGADRDAAWARFTEMSEGSRRHGERTDRVIPVIELVRRTG